MASVGSSTNSASFRSVIRGFHVYQEVWTPRLGETLTTKQEEDNPEDSTAVAVLKGSTIVGHMPREVSSMSWHFIGHGGQIVVTVTGKRQRSILLHQGGLEIPCIYKFSGPKKLIDKVVIIMSDMNFKSVE